MGNGFIKTIALAMIAAVLSLSVVILILVKYIPYAIILGSLLKVFGVISATWWQVAIWPGIVWLVLIFALAFIALAIEARKK
jgi:hypothetical protein